MAKTKITPLKLSEKQRTQLRQIGDGSMAEGVRRLLQLHLQDNTTLDAVISQVSIKIADEVRKIVNTGDNS